jgi:transcriptional regulator with XRE-family HTH domain
MISTLEQAGGAPAINPPAISPEEHAQRILTRVQQVCRGTRATQIAAATGVPRESVRRYLAGTTAPTGAFLAALCRSLGVSPAWLLLGQGEPFTASPPPLPGSAKDALRAAVSQLALRIEHLP